MRTGKDAVSFYTEQKVIMSRWFWSATSSLRKVAEIFPFETDAVHAAS